ncbi:hypothetical protein OHA10_27795 [Kribbella sp. NBC_00662]|uniref:hypothetical protein n=1 Tax=Kribbella sp. NBC_00662 TaxID=2975969 RepID=UPI003251FFD8
MKYIHTLVAIPVVAGGIVLGATTEASARVIDPEESYREPVVVVHERGPAVAVDDTGVEALQTGVGAIGGAGITIAALWAYRRRQAIHAH